MEYNKLEINFSIDNLLNTSLTTSEQIKANQSFNNRCKGKFITDYHYLAFYLDPRYLEYTIITDDEYIASRVYMTFTSYAMDLGLIENPEDSTNISEELSKFRLFYFVVKDYTD